MTDQPGRWAVSHSYSTGDLGYIYGPFTSEQDAEQYATDRRAHSQGKWAVWPMWPAPQTERTA